MTTTDRIVADYDIPDTDTNRARIDALVAARGVDATRRLMDAIHGTPDTIAAGHGHRAIMSSTPAVNGRIALGMIH